jgi:hypothetical protein
VICGPTKVGSGPHAARVSAVYVARCDKCLELNGRWRVTPGQPVRWMAAGEVRLGDLLMDGQGKWVPMTSLRTVQGDFEVYDLAIDDPAHTFFADGLLCHNKLKPEDH